MSNTALNANRASGIVSAYQRTAGANNPFLATGTPRVVNFTETKVDLEPDTTISSQGLQQTTAIFTIPRAGILGASYLKFAFTPKAGTVVTSGGTDTSLKINNDQANVLSLFNKIEWRFNNKVFRTLTPEQIEFDYWALDKEARDATNAMWAGQSTLTDGTCYWLYPTGTVSGADVDNAKFEMLLDVVSPFNKLTNDFLDSNPLKGALTLHVYLNDWGSVESLSSFSGHTQTVPNFATSAGFNDRFSYTRGASATATGAWVPSTYAPSMSLQMCCKFYDVEDYVYRQIQAQGDQEIVVKDVEPQFAPSQDGYEITTAVSAGTSVSVPLDNIFGAAQTIKFGVFTISNKRMKKYGSYLPIRRFRITGNGRDIVPWTTSLEALTFNKIKSSKAFGPTAAASTVFLYTAYFTLEENDRKAFGAQSFGHGMNNAKLEIELANAVTATASTHVSVVVVGNVMNTVSIEKGIIKNRLEE